MFASHEKKGVVPIVVAWIVVGVLSWGVAFADECSLRTTPEGEVFGVESFAVRMDRETGWPGDVLCDGRVIVQSPASRQLFDLKQNDDWVTGRGVAIERIGIEQTSSSTIRSRFKAGDWIVDAYVQLLPEQRMLRRWFDVTWNGTSDAKIKGFWFQGGQLPLSEAGYYFYPAAYPPTRVEGSQLSAGRNTSNGRSPYPVVADGGGDWSAVWMTDELPEYSDRGSVGVTESNDSIRVTQSFNMLGHVRPGVRQRVGDAWLWLQRNDGETALKRMPEWFRLVGQTPPIDRPDWLQRVILYSFHPGGTTGSQCRDLGGFQKATELLPHIRSLGCNAIWLMPLEDKSIYWPRDYYKFQEGLGGPEDYKQLTATAHALGMRVWQDCVPHGGSNQFPRAKEHPEWLAQNEDGSTLEYWCFDFNWPTWIDYMHDVADFYTREYGLDGFRIDACGGSKIPNWNPEIPYARASHAQAQGGLNMQRALREAVKASRPDGAVLAEAGASIHGAVSDSTYDFDLCYRVLHDFRSSPADVFAPRLRRWLHEQQCAEIPDLVRMRHVESHDSLRSTLWYGAAPQRALVALTSWIHGIPLVYHEMEDGAFDDYRRIFHVRNCVTELNGGAADYLSVSAPDGVFACLRTGRLPDDDSPAWSPDYRWDASPSSPDRASVVLVNLSDRPIRDSVSVPPRSLPAGLQNVGEARDVLTGESLAVRRDERDYRIDVTLPPFGYTVVRFGSSPLPPMPRQLVNAMARNESAPIDNASPSWELATDCGSLLIDSKTGFATAWRADGRTTPLSMDLALPENLAAADSTITSRVAPNAIQVTRSWGEHRLDIVYSKSDDGVDVQAEWTGGAPDGAAIVFDTPTAEGWRAEAAEGGFASPFRVRHPLCDGVIGSIYRLPQGDAVLWDSRLHPFGLSADRAWVGATCGEDGQLAFAFDPDCIPAYVQLLDRIEESHGLKVVVAWRTEDHGVTCGGDRLSLRLGASPPSVSNAGAAGDAGLQLVGGGWQFENEYLRARIARTGVLYGLWRKTPLGDWRQVLEYGMTYSDRGYGGTTRYDQSNDVETTARIERTDSGILLRFLGQMRGSYRYDKIRHPVSFYTSYLLDDSATLRYACAIRPDAAPTDESAFLSLMLRTLGGSRVAFADDGGRFLSADRDGGNRYAQTAKADDPRRAPRDIRIMDESGVLLRLANIRWQGAEPANVFMHRGDLHLAWMDGAPNAPLVGRWNGLSCSLACGDETGAVDPALPSDDAQGNALLRDGGFDAANSSAMVLLSSGLRLTRSNVAKNAWSFPPGGEIVVADENRCALIEGDGQSYRLIRQTVSTPDMTPGTTWRLTARMKGGNVQRADVDWKTACLRWAISVDGRMTYTSTNMPWGDSPWREYSVTMTVPEGADRIAVEAGLNGNQGRLWIDDVRVEPIDSK